MESVHLDGAVLYFNYFSQCYNVLTLCTLYRHGLYVCIILETAYHRTNFRIFCNFTQPTIPEKNIGSRQQLQKCHSQQINSENIAKSETIKYLGAWIDSNLSFKKHITERCKMAMWNLQKLKISESFSIKRYVTL